MNNKEGVKPESMKSYTAVKESSDRSIYPHTTGKKNSPYRTKPGRGTLAAQQAVAAVSRYRTVSAMQDDGNSIQSEAIDAAVLTVESAEAKRAKQRQKERYKKQYASPYYEKRRTATGKGTTKTGQQNSNQPKIKKKKKSSISPAKSIQRFIIVLIGSLMLVVLLFCFAVLPILLPFTVIGMDEETETEAITEDIGLGYYQTNERNGFVTDERKTFEIS